MTEILAATVGALVGGLATKGLDFWQQRRAERRNEERDAAMAAERERRHLEDLATLLHRTRRIFDDQREALERLMSSLRQSHPAFQPSRPGFEYWTSELFGDMTPDERALHSMVAGFTEDALVQANRELQQWLAANSRFRAGQQPTAQRATLAEQLDQLERHLDGWFVKYQRVFRADPTRALVYLADEDQLGPRFPQGLEPALDAVLHDGSGDGHLAART